MRRSNGRGADAPRAEARPSAGPQETQLEEDQARVDRMLAQTVLEEGALQLLGYPVRRSIVNKLPGRACVKLRAKRPHRMV